MNGNQDVPAEIASCVNYDSNDESIMRIMQHIIDRTDWPKDWVLFKRGLYAATLTPISKNEQLYQLTFWNEKKEPIGDVQVASLEEGLRKAYFYAFSYIKIAHPTTKNIDIPGTPGQI